jgi:hypothetical protein
MCVTAGVGNMVSGSSGSASGKWCLLSNLFKLLYNASS